MIGGFIKYKRLFTFGSIFVASLAVLILTVIRLNKYILNPSIEAKKEQEEIESIEVGGSDNYLKEIDTDSDGLSDFDELNIYNTSPYLPDTDSDGLSDFDEINQGTDPNCAKGAVCDNAFFKLENNNDFENLKPETETVNNVFEGMDLNNPDPERLRKILLDTGQLTKEQLDKISDKDLITVFRESISEVDTNIINSVNGF